MRLPELGLKNMPSSLPPPPPHPLQPLIARVNREIKRWEMADMSGLKRGARRAAGKWLAITELLCGWRIVLLPGR